MAQGPQLKPKKSRNLDFGVIAIVILLIVGIFIFINNMGNETHKLTYGDFEEALALGQIDSATISPVGGENENFVNITGEYTKNGETYDYIIMIPLDTFNNLVLPKLQQDGVEIHFKKLSTSNWLGIISFLLPIVLFIGLMVFLLRNSSSGNNKAFEFGKTRARLNRHSKVTFKDVAGVDEEKEELEEVIDFLKYPRKYFEIGARIPKGILLVGPPGTGKTLLAKAVAGEAKVPFFSISGSDFVEMFVGVGASRVRDMFKNAKQAAPCIVFIDEIDAVGRQRGAGLGGGHDEREQTLNQLLVEMDGFEENSGVIVLAATNRVDVLDPALLRPGRFDRQIRIPAPDVKGRTEILNVHARNKKLSPKINLEDISKRTPGFTGADLENLLNEAALLAAREGRKEIKIYDIDEAIDRVLMGPAKRSRKYSAKEKKIVSYHEAGHAVIGLKLENADIVQKVTIVPRGEAGGYNLMTPEEEHFLQTKSSLLDNITGLLAGRVAEELMIGEITTGAHHDFQRATAIARAMVTEYGMSKLGVIQYERRAGEVFLGRDYMKDKNFSDQVALEIDEATREIINDCYERAKKVLIDNKELLILIAEHLMEIETLTKEDIYELVNTKKLAWWEKKKAKEEAERIAKEKEDELQDIYRKQLQAMEDAKKKESEGNKSE
jgi:cell division protease FtsH